MYHCLFYSVYLDTYTVYIFLSMLLLYNSYHFIFIFINLSIFFIPRHNIIIQLNHNNIYVCRLIHTVSITEDILDLIVSLETVAADFPLQVTFDLISTVVALMQISAYGTHKNLAVRKITVVMSTAYAKNGTQSQHVSKHETNYHRTYMNMRMESAHHLQRPFYFVLDQAYVSLFPFVHISEFLYANISSTCVWCTHLLKS